MSGTQSTVMELIYASTSPLGDFKMPLCMQRIIRFNLSNLFHSDLNAVNALLSRYKEHVMFWGISPITVTNELREFGRVIGMDDRAIIRYYDAVNPSFWKEFIHTPFCNSTQASQGAGVIHYNLARNLTDCDCTCHR